MTPCSKCGCPETPREDQRIRDARIYKWKLAYNRMWRKKNRDKKNEYARRYYWKKKTRNWTVDIQKVEWHKTITQEGFSQMTYTPLYVHGGW